MTERISEIGPPLLSHQINQCVAQACQRLRRAATLGLAVIFTHRHITHVMLPVFNRPVPAPQCFQFRSPRLVLPQIGQAIADLDAVLTRFDHCSFTRPAHNLGDTWPNQIVRTRRTTLQRPRFETTMRFGDCLHAIALLPISTNSWKRKEQPQILVQTALIAFDN
jgi:hypothetical protein